MVHGPPRGPWRWSWGSVDVTKVSIRRLIASFIRIRGPYWAILRDCEDQFRF